MSTKPTSSKVALCPSRLMLRTIDIRQADQQQLKIEQCRYSFSVNEHFLVTLPIFGIGNPSSVSL
ncbi:MAG: hypothetical protein RMY34_21875 [Aulosira sp. DedQUE10]|nr:hypothetical protein [Aulosira sp. DedQUE10]